MQLDESAVVNNKLNILIRKDRLGEIGLLGSLFTDLTDVMQKLRSLKFTDVELSLLSAIVLFCPGKISLTVTLYMFLCLFVRLLYCLLFKTSSLSIIKLNKPDLPL